MMKNNMDNLHPKCWGSGIDVASLRTRPLYCGTDILIANLLSSYGRAICLASRLGLYPRFYEVLGIFCSRSLRAGSTQKAWAKLAELQLPLAKRYVFKIVDNRTAITIAALTVKLQFQVLAHMTAKFGLVCDSQLPGVLSLGPPGPC